jgi:hypothetical protein
MSIGRAIIIPALVTLGVTGSIMVAPAMSVVAAGHAPAVHVLADPSAASGAAGPNLYYHM